MNYTNKMQRTTAVIRRMERTTDQELKECGCLS